MPFIRDAIREPIITHPFLAPLTSPLFLFFGSNAPSPETLSLQLPPQPLPADQCAHHLFQNMKKRICIFHRENQIFVVVNGSSMIPPLRTSMFKKEKLSFSAKIKLHLEQCLILCRTMMVLSLSQAITKVALI